MNTRRNPKETSKRAPKPAYTPKSQPKAKANVPTSVKTYPVNEPAELLPFLLTHIANRGRNSIKSILSRGQISVNGKAVTQHNYQLHPGQTVTLNTEKTVQAEELIGLQIVHEDEDLIIIQKDAGLLSIATSGRAKKTVSPSQ